MKPFVLNQHKKSYAEVRELREQEVQMVVGGEEMEPGDCVTSTPNNDGGRDNNDG